MAMPTLPMTPVSSTFPSSNNSKFQDTSFPSYIDGAEETFVLQLGSTVTKADALYTPTVRNQVLLRKNISPDRELDVFNAEKYFKDALHSKSRKDPPSRQLVNKNERLRVSVTKERALIATPSIRSESSRNSRSALLHSIQRNEQPLKANRKSFLASIGCSCGDKNSVDIDDHYKEETRSRNSSRHVKFGVRDQMRDHPVTRPHSEERYVKFTEPKLGRNPIEQTAVQVFSSPVLMQNENNILSLKDKLTILSWDTPAPGVVEAAPSALSEVQEDDFSDASSDLFEIESLSKGDFFHSRACYAPSEASIEWSVVTASAADFSQEFKTNGGPSKDLPKRLPSFLSGCKSQKAVGVAGDAHIAKNKEFSNLRSNIRSASTTPISRFQEGMRA